MHQQLQNDVSMFGWIYAIIQPIAKMVKCQKQNYFKTQQKVSYDVL